MSQARLLAIPVLLLSFAITSHAGDNAAEVNVVLDKAVKAMGGPDKIGKLQNLTWKAKFSLKLGEAQLAFNMDASSQKWNRLRLDVDANINGMQKNLLLVMTPDKAWTRDGADVKEPPAKDIAPFRDIYFAVRALHMLPALKGKEFKLSHLGELNVKDRPTVGLRISRKDRPDVSIFFDKTTNLPVKAEVRITNPQGREIEIEMLAEDYKEFAGLKHFTRATFKFGGQEAVLEVSEVQPQEQLDATQFERP